jgi:adenine-specific DNA-methyltransferase
MAVNGKSKKIDYSNWSQTELIKEIKKLEKRKKYGIIWDEERTKEVFEEQVQEKLPVLKDVTKNGIEDSSKPNNILIEGDNYHALSVLNYTHKRKVDVIYIDPPYNIGKEFRYNDKLVDLEDSYRHSKWLSFMSKRLRLAKKLLKHTGIIFISINDNEVAQLRILCDEIFGDKNFISCIVNVNNPKGRSDDKYIARAHEYVLVYKKKDAMVFGWSLNEKILKRYNKLDKNRKKYREIDLRKTGDNDRKEDRLNLFYFFLYNEKTGDFYATRDEKIPKNYLQIIPIKENGDLGNWRWELDNANLNKKYLIPKLMPTRKIWSVFEKDYLDPQRKIKPTSAWTDTWSNSERGSKQFIELGFDKSDFLNPKPIGLIKKICEYSLDKNGIILDFFAGSGTTGHAILDLNKEDGGNRKFILCTNNENNICTDVCYPRLKKVIKGYKNSKNEKIEGLGGNLKYFKTSFVDSELTDQNKKNLVEQSTEMLCIKEDCFELIKEGKQFKIFKNHNDKYLGIIYFYEGIKPLKKEILKLNKKINTYVFSLTDEIDVEEFIEVDQLVTLKPIPSAILNVYRRIFAYVQIKKLPRKTRK